MAGRPDQIKSIEQLLIAEAGPDYGMMSDPERKIVREHNRTVSKCIESVQQTPDETC
jgi:hypothetical protein